MNIKVKTYYYLLAVLTIVLATSPLGLASAQTQETPINILASIKNGESSIGASVTELPQVAVKELAVSLQSDNSITGSFSVINNGDTILGDLRHEIILLGPAPSPQIDASLIPDTSLTYLRLPPDESFTLYPDTRRAIDIDFQAPIIPAGEYRLRLQIVTGNDRRLSFADTLITLTGTPEQFVSISPQSISVDSTDPVTQETRSDWAPLVGVNVEPEQALTINALLINTGDAPIDARPVFQIRRLLSQDQSTVVAAAKNPIVIPAKTQLLVPILVNANLAPGAYAIFLSLTAADDTTISNYAEYRYVVSGASASVVSQSLKNLPVKKGNTAEIKFEVVGSADRNTKIAGNIKISILDNNKPVGSTQNTLSFNGLITASGTAYVTLTNNICGHPSLQTVLSDQAGQILETYTSPITLEFPADCSIFDQTTTGLWLALLIVIFLIIAITITYFFTRKRQLTLPSDIGSLPTSNTITSLLLLVGLGAALASNVINLPRFASANGITYTSPEFAASLFVNTPLHLSSLTKNNIPFEARLEWTASRSAIGDANLNVFSLADGGSVSQINTTQTWTPQLTTSVLPSSNTDLAPANLDFIGLFSLPNKFLHPNTTIWTHVSTGLLKSTATSEAPRSSIDNFIWLDIDSSSP